MEREEYLYERLEKLEVKINNLINTILKIKESNELQKKENNECINYTSLLPNRNTPKNLDNCLKKYHK